jgi:phospholipid/cholesterol/gamma-HCH transport system permease protein
MVPLLTIFFNLFGLAGGGCVMVGLGYPSVTYVRQILAWVGLSDVLGGLVKSVFLGLMVAGVGCLHGLQTGTGPSAVGESTTSAVVGAIVLIVVVDGVFAVVYYQLGI